VVKESEKVKQTIRFGRKCHWRLEFLLYCDERREGDGLPQRAIGRGWGEYGKFLGSQPADFSSGTIGIASTRHTGGLSRHLRTAAGRGPSEVLPQRSGTGRRLRGAVRWNQPGPVDRKHRRVCGGRR